MQIFANLETSKDNSRQSQTFVDFHCTATVNYMDFNGCGGGGELKWKWMVFWASYYSLGKDVKELEEEEEQDEEAAAEAES